jgi:hypothetical protein
MDVTDDQVIFTKTTTDATIKLAELGCLFKKTRNSLVKSFDMRTILRSMPVSSDYFRTSEESYRLSMKSVD